MFKCIPKAFLGVLLLVGSFLSVHAQVPGGKNKASDYSDQEILQMINKAESAGLSEAQVVEIARARGMSEVEIEAFRERVTKVKNNTRTPLSNPAAAANGRSSNDQTKPSIENTKPAEPSKGDLTNPTQQNANPANNNVVPKAGDEIPEVPQNIGKTANTAPSDIIVTSWDISKLFDESRFPSYSNGRSLKAPDQYIIGVGDEISVTVFGNSYFNKVSRVDDRGRIDLGTAIGKVYVKGLAFAKLEPVIRAAVSQKINISGNEMEIDLSFSRQVSINVTGEVQRPGTYQIPAANTVFNLLVLSGGPTGNGSVRDIEILRAGKVAYRFDVYAFLVNPQNNLFLEDGDFVLVKPARKRVRLNGGVLRPGTVELLPNEGLKEALMYAGGFSTLADASRLTLSRLNGKSRTLYPLNFSGETKEPLPVLQNGDEIYVFQQSEEAQNQVEVKGEVYFPGRYALTEGVGLKNILEQAGGITLEANTEKAFLIRRFTDGEVEYMPFSLDSVGLSNTILQDRDQIVIFKKEYFKDNFKIQISGEVRNPQNIPYKEGINIQTLIDYAGGLTSEANLEKAFLIRSYTNGEIEYLPFSLDSLGKAAIKLQARDKIVIFKKEYFKDNFSVEIRGEVRNPLSLPYTEGLSIQTLIDYAGGFNFKADLTEIEILRSHVFTKDFKSGERNKTIKIAVPFNKETNKLEDVVLQPEDIVVVRQISNLNDRIVVRVEGEWIHPGTYVLIKGTSKVSDLIKLSGGLTAFADANSAQLYRKEGAQVVFDLRSVLRSKRSAFNYNLVDGDRLVVRVKPDVVYVPNTDTLVSKNLIIAPFIAGKRAGYYMRNYTMSYDKDHLKRRLYVEHPGGQIKRARHYGLFVLTPKVKPGSIIKFQPSPPEKEEKPDLEPKKETDWNRIIENFTVKLTGVATLWILLSRI